MLKRSAKSNDVQEKICYIVIFWVGLVLPFLLVYDNGFERQFLSHGTNPCGCGCSNPARQDFCVLVFSKSVQSRLGETAQETTLGMTHLHSTKIPTVTPCTLSLCQDSVLARFCRSPGQDLAKRTNHNTSSILLVPAPRPSHTPRCGGAKAACEANPYLSPW